MRARRLSYRAIARAFAEVLSDVPVVRRPAALRACARFLERRGLLHRAPAVLALLDEELLQRTGRQRASVVTAEELTPRAGEPIERFLRRLVGVPVSLRETVNAQVRAGFQADVGDLFVDASLLGQLQRLRASLRRAHPSNVAE